MIPQPVQVRKEIMLPQTPDLILLTLQTAQIQEVFSMII